MSNEEEIKRDNDNDNDNDNEGPIITATSTARANPKDYALLVSNTAVAQICRGLGFDSLSNSSLLAFSNILLQFILDLGKSATFHANLASRSHSNFFDIIQAFKDLGFTCSSTLFVKRMSDFVNAVEDNPFGNSIPRFPVSVVNKGLVVPSFAQLGENSGGKHIPHWLPAFPDPHTYVNSPLWSSKKLDLRIDKGEQARQRRKAERSLLNLQQRLLSCGLAGPSGCGDDGEGKGVENGVFEKKHLLVKEAFGPAIDALKGVGDGDGDDDDDDDDRRGFGSNAMSVDKRVMVAPVPMKRRPVVQFKMKAGKKMLVEDLDIHIRSLVCEKRGSFVRDDDRDDKKRRAEFILRQSAIEYPQEVSQM